MDDVILSRKTMSADFTIIFFTNIVPGVLISIIEEMYNITV